MADIFIEAPEQPYEIDWRIVDDVFVKHITVADSGVFLPQHAHEYQHQTVVACGSVTLWKDGEYDGVYSAPAMLVIEAKVKHLFQTLEPNTVILCIHNAARPDVAAVFSEHQLL